MKLGQLYNMGAMKNFCDSQSAEKRFGITDADKQKSFSDSSAGTILARQLTHVNPTIFEKKFPELAFINSGIQADNTGGYSRRIQSLRLQEEGGFTTAGDASGNRGKISLAGEDSFIKVIERESESTWSDSQIKEAELGGVNLPSRYVQAHNGIYMRELDEIGLVGKSGEGIAEGLLNYSGFNSGSAGDVITNLTAQEMYDEYATLITDQWNAVNNTAEYKANRVITPTYALNKLAETILNSANGAMSVLMALKANFPGIEFLSSFRADSVGGASSTVAYNNSMEVMSMRVPVPLTIGEIIKVGSFDFKVDSKYRVAGLDILEDTGGRILTGL